MRDDRITFDQATLIPDGSGDLLVLTIDRAISRDEVERVKRAFEEASSDARRVLILDGGLRIEELSDEDLARLGLQRVPKDAA